MTPLVSNIRLSFFSLFLLFLFSLSLSLSLSLFSLSFFFSFFFSLLFSLLSLSLFFSLILILSFLSLSLSLSFPPTPPPPPFPPPSFFFFLISERTLRIGRAFRRRACVFQLGIRARLPSRASAGVARRAARAAQVAVLAHAAAASCTCLSSALRTSVHLLVHDRLQHTLTHRADRAGDLHVRLPFHLRAAVVGLGENRRQPSMLTMAPTPLPLACSFAYSGWRSSSFVKSNRHAAARRARAGSSRSRASAGRPSIVEPTRHRASVFAIRSGEFSTSQTISRGAANVRRPLDPHGDVTSTPSNALARYQVPPTPGGTGCSCASTARLAARTNSASCRAAHTAWIPAPPPSPMPFAPSGVNGDGDSR